MQNNEFLLQSVTFLYDTLSFLGLRYKKALTAPANAGPSFYFQ